MTSLPLIPSLPLLTSFAASFTTRFTTSFTSIFTTSSLRCFHRTYPRQRQYLHICPRNAGIQVYSVNARTSLPSLLAHASATAPASEGADVEEAAGVAEAAVAPA